MAVEKTVNFSKKKKNPNYKASETPHQSDTDMTIDEASLRIHYLLKKDSEWPAAVVLCSNLSLLPPGPVLRK